MDYPDIINGIFEMLGAPFLFINIMRLRKDKELKGVSWVPVTFFALWGFWNLYYYPQLGQSWSFIGSAATVAANMVWLAHLVYYYMTRKRR